MKVAMLAAGTGSRLAQGPGAPPRVLLRFAGRSLLERHLGMLKSFGGDDLTIATGYRAAAIRATILERGTIDVGDLPWVEIDFSEDLERARMEILPTRQPSLIGFEIEDVLYLVAPITWLGALGPFLVLVGCGAPLYLCYVVGDAMRLRSDRSDR